MVSRARSGTGSGSPASQLSVQGKSFLTARGAGGWSGLLPEEVNCLTREVFWPPFHRGKIRMLAGSYRTPLICQAPSITLLSFILSTKCGLFPLETRDSLREPKGPRSQNKSGAERGRICDQPSQAPVIPITLSSCSESCMYFLDDGSIQISAPPMRE